MEGTELAIDCIGGTVHDLAGMIKDSDGSHVDKSVIFTVESTLNTLL